LNQRVISMPYLLAQNDPSAAFPDVREALREPDGLLAVGGDLGVARLVAAYRHGIFPWYSEGDPILWWSPDPRTVLIPGQLRISRSLRKLLRGHRFAVSMDRDFPAVINACAMPREPSGGTWLVPEMISAYKALHEHGLAHSVEVWQGGALVGGLYGVAIGGVFFGESMFTRVDNASKVALVHLCRRLADWRFELIDCQVLTGHLIRMGAGQMPREEFVRRIEALRDRASPTGSWDDGSMRYPAPPSAEPPNPSGQLAADCRPGADHAP
jgi:leucyl/phenylalanyl-tRNA--protein transferase